LPHSSPTFQLNNIESPWCSYFLKEIRILEKHKETLIDQEERDGENNEYCV